MRAVWPSAAPRAVRLLTLLTSPFLCAEDGDPRRVYKTQYLTIHTDADEKNTKELLVNLEKIFGQLIDYFGAKPVTMGTGFVVVDLNQFPEIPPDAAAKVTRQEGITHTERSSYLDEKGKISEVQSRTVTFY